MRIDDPQHREDYYDKIATSFPGDEAVVYRRETRHEIIPDQEMPWPFGGPEIPVRGRRNFPRHAFKPAEWEVIGFCGRVYAMAVLEESVRVEHGCEIYHKPESELLTYHCYTIDALVEAMNRPPNPGEGDAFAADDRTDPEGRTPLEVWIDAFEEAKRHAGEHAALFGRGNAPTFHARRSLYSVNRTNLWGTGLTWNPILADFGFRQVVEPYDAYEQVETFVRMQASPNPHVPTLSNDDLAAAKGFDPKTAFRMDSPGSKRRRRAK